MIAPPATWMRLALLALALIALGPAHVLGQSSGSVQATGSVLQAITITGVDLDFGNVVPTQTRTVAPGSASAGRFALTLEPNTSVTATFELPSTLGTNVLVDSWSGLLNTTNAIGSATSIAFGATGGTFVWSSPTGQIYVWLGARVTTTGAVPGTYSAPVRLTVAYN